jgi:glucose-1-phosphate adenylyltransferase
MPSNVISLILGGGRGTRLFPLTKDRSKPAVPIAGKYRLIDIPISNCLNSDLQQIYVLTQFNSVSLHRHIANTYKFDPFGRGFVEILAAQQTMQSEKWYEGTADAVRRNILYFNDTRFDLVLILSGDQLYRMDYQKMIREHRESGSQVTIAVLPVHEKDVPGFGITKIDESGRVIDFVEKPKTAEARSPVRTDPQWMEEHGIRSGGREYLANMGIYLFDRKYLIDLLQGSEATDFGKEIFPQTINQVRVQSHLFDGYWEDIGTIGAFHQANIDLTLDRPAFDFLDGDKPIYSRARYLAGSRFQGASVDHSVVSDGCRVGRGSTIIDSVIGVRSQINENVTVRESYVMGADFYESDEDRAENARLKRPAYGIGANSVIQKAIIDKNVRIGRNVRLLNEQNVQEADTPYVIIRDGIIVVPKWTIIPDGYLI